MLGNYLECNCKTGIYHTYTDQESRKEVEREEIKHNGKVSLHQI